MRNDHSNIDLRPDGVYKSDESGEAIFVAPYIDHPATAYFAENGNETLEVIEFDHPERGRVKLLIPPSLYEQLRKLRAFLIDNGYQLPSGDLGLAIVKELQAKEAVKTILLMKRTGWSPDGTAFVGPNICVSRPDAEGNRQHLYDPNSPITPADLSRSGDLDGWKAKVCGLGRYSDTLIWAICLALAAFIARLLGVSRGIFHLSGDSRQGKTGALLTAQSVWGYPKGGEPLTWGKTDTAWEETAAAHSDLLMPVDELARGSGGDKRRKDDLAETITNVSYLFAGGRPKERSRSASKSLGLSTTTWWGLALSAGEESPEEVAAAAGVKKRRGEEVRFRNVPASPAKGDGIFDKLPPGYLTRDQALRALRDAVKEHHGVALEPFIEKVLAEPDIKAKVEPIMERFFSLAGVGSDAWDRDFARGFALTYAAGKLAVEWGIVPWSRKKVGLACRKVYKRAVQHPVDVQNTMRSGLKRLAAALKGDDLLDLTGGAKATSDNTAIGYRVTRRRVESILLKPERLNGFFEKEEQRVMVLAELDRLRLWIPAKSEGPLSHRAERVPGLKARIRYACLVGDAADRIDAALKPRSKPKKLADAIPTKKTTSNRRAKAVTKPKLAKGGKPTAKK